MAQAHDALEQEQEVGRWGGAVAAVPTCLPAPAQWGAQGPAAASCGGALLRAVFSA